MNKTQTKIIEATISQIERIGLQVTTKQIANAADVNELTLFRNFGTKQQLMIAAVGHLLGPMADKQRTPSGDMHADLTSIAAAYTDFTDSHPGALVQILSATDPELVRTIVLPLQRQIEVSLTQLMTFYKQRGELAAVPTEDLIREFMGPLLVRAFLRNTIVARPLRAKDYVRRFIRGHENV